MFSGQSDNFLNFFFPKYLGKVNFVKTYKATVKEKVTFHPNKKIPSHFHIVTIEQIMSRSTAQGQPTQFWLHKTKFLPCQNVGHRGQWCDSKNHCKSKGSDPWNWRVLQTIQIKLILLCAWAEPVILGSAKTALIFKYEI